MWHNKHLLKMYHSSQIGQLQIQRVWPVLLKTLKKITSARKSSSKLKRQSNLEAVWLMTTMKLCQIQGNKQITCPRTNNSSIHESIMNKIIRPQFHRSKWRNPQTTHPGRHRWQLSKINTRPLRSCRSKVFSRDLANCISRWDKLMMYSMGNKP